MKASRFANGPGYSLPHPNAQRAQHKMKTTLELHCAMLEASKQYSEASQEYEANCDELGEAETAAAVGNLNDLRTTVHQLQNEYAVLVENKYAATA